jgi:hypothetical protein
MPVKPCSERALWKLYLEDPHYGSLGYADYHDWAPLVMREAELTLAYRVPSEQRLSWARKIADGLNGRLPQTLPEVYALEQIYLHEKQRTELKIQALRIGDLGIAAIPNEVFAITGLKIKAQSPLQPTFNIELANGAEGYIPPPEQHKLGGYTTWPARTAGLEPQAEPRIVEKVLALLEQVSGKPRRKLADTHGSYAKSVLASKPVAYWRLNEFNGPTAHDASGHHNDATYEDGIVFCLAGPPSPAFSGETTFNHCPHFAGGRVNGEIKLLGHAYSVEFWFWNGFPNNARAVTGYLFSRDADGKTSAWGDRLAISGTNGPPGGLLFFNGNRSNKILTGKTAIKERTWNHVVLVRDSKGNFIPDLKKDDFEVYEDGVLQDISSMTVVTGGRVTNALLPPAAPAPEGVILPPAKPKNDVSGRIFVFFVDDQHLQFGNTSRVRQLFQKISKELVHDGDLFGIVSSGPSSTAVWATCRSDLSGRQS